MERKVFRIEAVKEKNCYTCKYIKFKNGYGRCAESGFLVNESNYCSGWRNQKWMEKSKMITREKALKKIFFLYEDGFCKEDLGILINKIYDSFEQREIFLATKDVLCNDCIYYLSDNGNYPLEPCTDCSRFYSDKFVSNKPL